MANNHEQFIAFEDRIYTDSKRAELRKNREALRERIRSYYKDNYPDDIHPKFHMQGSYAMHTLLNPIIKDGKSDYDMDDGIYFIGDLKKRLTISEYHERILAAVEEHTDNGAKDNDPCVTVYYADGHHVDLPIYFMQEGDEHPKLGHKKSGWTDSDPRDFYKWFNGKPNNAQLRRMVHYLKAWADFVHKESGVIMPSGCIMTILADKYYVSDDRDDFAFKNMIVAMYNNLSVNFECKRPTFPKDEDLFDNSKWKSRKKDFMNELKSFKEDAERAVNSKNPHDACLKWQLHFGSRFCCSAVPDRDEDAITQESAGPQLNNSRFA